MKSSTTSDFWAAYRALPPHVRRRARLAFRLWQANPRHPSLRFKSIGEVRSVRIGRGYRALGILDQDTIYWFWIGPHDEYERLLTEQ